MTNAINTEIAARLREVASLLDEQGANQFRIRAYKRAAETMRSLKRPVDKLIKAAAYDDRLAEIGGFGQKRIAGSRVVRGRESECAVFYEAQ